MTVKTISSKIGASLFAVALLVRFASATDVGQSTKPTSSPAVDLFDAVENNQAEVKFIAKNDHDARLLIKNNTNQPLNLRLPEAFVGVPALAQFGGGGRGGGGGARGGGGGGRGGTSGGGGQQSVGGGLGGGGGGFGGGGGGQFSIPPEETAKIDANVVCLDHGLRTPNGSAAYNIVPAGAYLEDKPAVVELLKAFGHGDLERDAVQAAAWHLNSGMSWDKLAAKLDGTRRSAKRSPYFTAAEIRAGMAYASESARLAEANADEYAKEKKARAEKAAKAQRESSDARSTTDTDSKEPVKEQKEEKTEKSDESTEKSS